MLGGCAFLLCLCLVVAAALRATLVLLVHVFTVLLQVLLPQVYSHGSLAAESRLKMSRLPDVEKDHAGSDSVNGRYDDNHLHHDHHTEETALRRMRTAGSITITPELFEKIYLSPKNQVSNNIRSTVGNPTPLYGLYAEMSVTH